MCKLNDTIADINMEVDTVLKLLDTVLELKGEVKTNEDTYDSEVFEDLMWHYDCAIDGLKSAISELRDASDKLVKC